MNSGARRVSSWLFAAFGAGAVLGLAAVLLPRGPTNLALTAGLLLILPFAFAVARNVERFAVFLILFETAIPLDVFLGFRADAAELSALPGFPVSLTTILLGGLYLSWTLRRLGGLQHADPGLLRAYAPLALYVAATAASWVSASDPQLAMFEVGLLAQMLLLFVYLVHTIRTPSDLRFVMSVLVAVLAVEALIMTGLVVIGQSIEIGPFLARIDPGTRTRVAGTVGSPNAAGAFLTLLLLPTLATWRQAETGTERFLAVTTFLLAVVMLVFTLSRGAWLGFAVGTVLFLAVGGAKRWLSRPFVGAVLLFGAVVGVALSGFIYARLFGPEVSPIIDRIALMRVAFAMMIDHIWTGVGANGFTAALPDYLDARFAGSFVSVVHNKYLIVGAETGVVGMATFVAFLSTTLWRGWTTVRRSTSTEGVTALGLVAGFSGVTVHMFFDLFHGRSDTQILIVIAALITAAWRVFEKQAGAMRAP